ncbi:membrane protein [Lysobacter daejeonensis GH1-9]|uniref:Membrane protein n=1 Tax=Lysobacter daejeonensis GH1-9 TaxID=1385517 RepID=A0A0A0EZZ0_9GAMM|nr:membrane protein [Lysobacter daejeonensis]KGM54722.1 membrane protein [Lysobacter daejeonensis GH1-9]
MSVTLIAVIIALLLGHLAQPFVAALRQYDWFTDWLRWLSVRFGEGSAWRGRFGIAIAMVPPLLVVGLFQLALDLPLLGLVGLLFAVAVLVYAWGPRDLDVDVDAITAASDPVARREAAARLWPAGQEPLMDGGSLVEAVFRNALRRWFGVLLWFLLLGPVGALLYRLAVLAVEGEAATQLPSTTSEGARRLLAVLDWPVAQLMTLALALVGNFDTVLAAWREAGGASASLDNRFLSAVARASVRSELVEEASDYADENGVVPARYMAVATDLPELRDAMSLVWRCLLVWLAVLALFVIAGWVS